MRRWRPLVFLLFAMVLVACSGSGPAAQNDSAIDPSQETNPAALAAAESGELGRPALVFFHADWCDICQRIGPDVKDLQTQYDGRVAIVGMNVDNGESRPYLEKYDVRGAPTFVLFDDDGTMLATVPGWPGKDRFVQAFDQVLAAN